MIALIDRVCRFPVRRARFSRIAGLAERFNGISLGIFKRFQSKTYLILKQLRVIVANARFRPLRYRSPLAYTRPGTRAIWRNNNRRCGDRSYRKYAAANTPRIAANTPRVFR